LSLPDMALIEVRLRPTTPWRVGHGAGDRERVDVVYHSDALYSAITHAMKTLGWLDEWLAATAQSSGEPAVRFSSLFPFIGKTRLVAPPKTWWPPANPGRLYTEAAKLIPLEVVRNGIVDESRWMVDGETGCMFHTGSGAPVKIVVRTAAAIDRLTGVADPHRIACLEFAPNAGWWGCFAVEDATWEARVKAAFRLLADSGFGGERSRGWGRAAAPEFSDASSLLPSKVTEEGAWWLLSMYSPDAGDAVDWARGEYGATQRGGWTDSQAGVAPKKQVRVIEEGSVVFAASLRGRAVDVAPEGFAHPVYRAGFALAVPAPPEPAMRPAQVAPTVVPEIETPAEVAEEVEAEAEMLYEGGPPEPPVRAEAEAEPEVESPEVSGESMTPAPPVAEPIEQPVAAPERELESTGSAVIDEPADVAERSESSSVETDTQGSSSDEELL
jgi:CRISPR type III-A-associated RAMP protein Csm4